MENPMGVQATFQYVVTIPTDEYVDLLSTRTKLDVICDLLDTQTYVDKGLLLLVARGVPTPRQLPEQDETLVPEPDPIF